MNYIEQSLDWWLYPTDKIPTDKDYFDLLFAMRMSPLEFDYTEEFIREKYVSITGENEERLLFQTIFEEDEYIK